jgi:hypothetical protein
MTLARQRDRVRAHLEEGYKQPQSWWFVPEKCIRRFQDELNAVPLRNSLRSGGLEANRHDRADSARWPDEWHRLPCLRAACLRRHSNPATSSSWTTYPPQRLPSARCNRGSRRATALPATLQPRLHSIEKAFAKLKALLRKAGERSVEGREAPRRAPGSLFGECGSIAAHASSLNQNRSPFCLSSSAIRRQGI